MNAGHIRPALLSVLLCARIASAQNAAGSVRIDTNIADGRWLNANDTVEVVLDARTSPSGRLAVFIDDTDWTALFTRRDRALTYRPGPLELPRGEHALVVYVVTAQNAWQEQARFPLRVRTAGFEHVQATRVLDGALTGQAAEGHSPEANAPPRATFQDLRVTAGLRTTAQRGAWTTDAGLDIVGVSRREEALQYPVRQGEAPFVDLSSYVIGTKTDQLALSLGHATFDVERHLVSNFTSRGATARLRLGRAADLAAAALNGSAIAGWNNPLGFAESQHRVFAATFGVELLPNRPGGLRAEVSGVKSAKRPLTNVNQQAITDAERSHGVGFRVFGTDPRQRLRIDGGLARSTFANPLDPWLAQGTAIVPVREETRNARYLDATYAVVQNTPLRPNLPLSIAATYRHERVDPLFSSVTPTNRPDVLQHAIDVSGAVGAAAVQVTYARTHDNLDGFASLLTTFTRLSTVNAMLPLSIFRTSPTSSWPSITYQLAHTWQYANGIPANSGFSSASQVPNQLSRNQIIGVDWQREAWHLAYQFNHSSQDNRQVGRERADFFNLVHHVILGVSHDTSLDVNAEIDFEGARSLETSAREVTKRYAVAATWRLRPETMINGAISTSFVRDEQRTRDNQHTDLNVQFSQSVRFGPRTSGRPQARLFVRLTRQSTLVRDALFALNDARHLWTLNTGVTLSVF